MMANPRAFHGIVPAALVVAILMLWEDVADLAVAVKVIIVVNICFTRLYYLYGLVNSNNKYLFDNAFILIINIS
jgi:hypothetical protein